MLVVSNTSPIINLAVIDQLDLLRGLFGKIVIPKAVFEEIAVAGEGEPGSVEVQTSDWITVRPVSNAALVKSLEIEMHPGEAESIALASESNADLLLLDERIARNAAARLGIRVAGVVGVLLAAKRNGLIPAVKPLLDDVLEKAGFWLDPELCRKVLTTAGE